jgi:hypothetical protein
MKIRNNEDQEWKSDNANNATGNNITIKSEELKVDPLHLWTPRTQTAEIKITFHRPTQRQNNGLGSVNLRKLLKLKHHSNNQ